MYERENMQIFISYSTQNKEVADSVCKYLEGYSKHCWIAPRNIPAGAEYGGEIIKGIESSDVMVLILSEASNKSQHVLREVERAVGKNIPIIVFRIEKCSLSKSLEYFLLSNQWLDAKPDDMITLASLNSSIDRLLEEKQQDTEDNISKKNKPVRIHNKAIPVMLGFIAIAILVAAIIIKTGSKSDNEENENKISNGDGISPTVTTIAENIPKTKLPEFKAGDIICLGNYYPVGYKEGNDDSQIKWAVMDIDHEKGIIKLISAGIIDIKPFDCAESGHYDRDKAGNSFDREKLDSYSNEDMRNFRGGNTWADSDIRCWLNASGIVTYSGSTPSDEATDEFGNAFGSQKGFLSAFTEDELALFCKNTDITGLDDLVYLLSVDEINNYMKNDSFPLHPYITKSAVDSDKTSWYSTYLSSGADDYLWVTRSAAEDNAFQVYVVDSYITGNTFALKNAASSGFGIRPAVTLSLESMKQTTISGNGTDAEPYILKTTEK